MKLDTNIKRWGFLLFLGLLICGLTLIIGNYFPPEPKIYNKPLEQAIAKKLQERDSLIAFGNFHKHRADSLDAEFKKMKPVKPIYFPAPKLNRPFVNQDSATVIMRQETGDSSIQSTSGGILIPYVTTLNLIDGLREQKANKDYITSLEAYADSLTKQVNLCSMASAEKDTVMSSQGAALLADKSIQELMNIEIIQLKGANSAGAKRVFFLQTKIIVLEVAIIASATYIVYRELKQ